ncbi:MAG: J domain-containing protein [Actinomycetota bacterium]
MRVPPTTEPHAADPYEVLGLDLSATPAQIKSAYFALVRAHSPERDPQRFKEIRAAYEQLNSPEKRLETDMLRVQVWPEPPVADQAPPELRVAPEDIIRAARAASDLARTDWREDFREVRL